MTGGALQAGATHECGVCWRPFDPAAGDDSAGIAPGTPFDALPEAWCCPACEAPKHRFLPLGATDAPPPRAALLRRALEAGYRRVAETMRGLRLVNARLAVEATAFRATGPWLAGAVVTPWSVNLVLMPQAQAAPPPGTEQDVELPSGTYTAVAATLPETGGFLQISLFSPADGFDSHDAALTAARAALDAALASPTPPAAQVRQRRALLGLPA